MPVFAVRWRDFRCFRDTGWVGIRPLTILIGPNSGGKTSVLAPLLMLKQTLDARDERVPLIGRGELADAGHYRDMVRDHQTDRKIRFHLWDRPRTPDFRDEPEKDSGGPYGSAPDRLELTFRNGDGDGPAKLASLVVRADDGRVYLRRSSRKRGGYTFNFFEDLPAGNRTERAVRRAIRQAVPTNFFFPGTEVLGGLMPRGLPSAWRTFGEFSRAQSGRLLSRPAIAYMSMLMHQRSSLIRFVDSIRYVGPLRSGPSREYRRADEETDWVGVRGERAADVFSRLWPTETRPLVQEWLTRFGFGDTVECVGPDGGRFAIELLTGARRTNLVDAGFGFSQVFPLVVQAFGGPQDALVIAEQPEIHLNPRLQVLLGDLFATMVRRGQRVIVETHSEHLVLRLRTLVAQGELKADDVALLFVECSRRGSTVRRIPVEENGHIDASEWPRGFFEDSLHQVLNLAAAQTRPDTETS